MKRVPLTAWIALGLAGPLCAAEVEPPPPPDAEILGHIQGLGAEGFRARRDSQRTLETLGREYVDAVLRNCVAVYATNTDVEVEQRLDEIMFLLVDKELFDAPKGFMGIRLSKKILPGEGEEVVHVIEVNEVIENTGAAAAGLEIGDLILAVNGKPVPSDPNTLTFTAHVQSFRPGTVVDVAILRGEDTKVLKLKLGERPREAQVYFRYQQSVEEFYDQWLAAELAKAGGEIPADGDDQETSPAP